MGVCDALLMTGARRTCIPASFRRLVRTWVVVGTGTHAALPAWYELPTSRIVNATIGAAPRSAMANAIPIRHTATDKKLSVSAIGGRGKKHYEDMWTQLF